MTIASSTATTLQVSYPCGGDIVSAEPCRWEEMHHVDDEGRHWCPTGFLLCHTHFGTGTITGPGTCHLWGEYPIETTGRIVRRSTRDETDLTDKEVTAMWDEGTPTDIARDQDDLG